jgi:cellulose synthase/poly-beta-1,6-N-acetylglucosamine synthase-like glycosyltransferase
VALVRGRLFPRPVRSGDATPSVSLVIAAHNEEAGLGRKLESVLAGDYPSHLLDVVVASDGSTDGTVDVARAFGARGVRVLDLPRTGKATALNDAVATCRSDIIVLSDANNPLAPDALRRLTAPFADMQVGGVAGDQRYLPTDEADSAAGERGYWSVDRLVKSAESAGGNVISATGALYAVRRALFPTVVDGVTDDFYVSTNVIRAGHRLVLAADAVVYEIPAERSRLEFARKVRVMTRGLRGVYERRDLLNPRKHGFYSVQLLCHKVLRRLMVVPLAAMWLTSLLAARKGGRFWLLAAAAQSGGYALGAIGLVVRVPGKVGRFVQLASYFVMINAASAVAVWNLLRGRRITTWEPARSAEPPE